MPSTSFFSLTTPDQIDALGVAASKSGRPAHLLEKDVWVVLTLQALFDAPFGDYLTFKGGTSLSKGYQAIRRFSEDLDITYDIRRLVPELAYETDQPLPSTRSQARKWRTKISRELHKWAADEALKAIQAGVSQVSESASIRVDTGKVYVSFQTLVPGNHLVKPEVMVEFGGRATGEPRENRDVVCDAAPFLPDIVFPFTRPFTMLAARTFWEKATLIHVFCEQLSKRGERLSRHWHDLVRLDDASYGATALADRHLAQQVAEHKAVFFPERNAAGEWVDYGAAVSGHLRLTPGNEARDLLANDYQQMLQGGMLEKDAEPFTQLMERCADIESRANA